MATESIISLRGFVKIALAVLLFSVCICQGAGAATSSSVVATGPISAVASHPATWGQVWETAISSKGDLFLEDFEHGGVYLFPAGGGSVVTLVAAGNTWTNSGIALDPWNNLWLGDNWNGELLRIPYTNGTWNMSDPNIITYQLSWNSGNQAFNGFGTTGGWFQPSNFSFSPNVTNTSTNTAIMAVADEGNGVINSFTVDAQGNVDSGTTVVSSLSASSQVESIAVDDAGNIYFYEKGNSAGILMAPAGTSEAKDTSLARIDPNLASPDGVTVDAQGNLYLSDASTGVYFEPNVGGTPKPSNAVLIAAVPALSNVDFDLVRGILYVPTQLGENKGWKSPSGVVYDDVVAVSLSSVSLGNYATGVQGTTQTIDFGFDGSVTPASFAIVESGTSTPDFVITSAGTCKTGTTYAAGQTCTVVVALDAHTVGSVSAKLEMLDANSNILASFSLTGMGLNPAVVTGPISAVATHPATWGQTWNTAISTYGDLVIDDFEQGAIYEFPAGGGAMITLASPGNSGPAGGWGNMGIAIDPWNNMWIGQNWNSDLMRIPYDSVHHTWNLTGSNNTIYTSGNLGANPNWFQAGALAVSSNVTNGTATMVVSAENVPAIYSYSIDANGNFSNGATVVSSLKGRAKTLAIDTTGNIYFFEDGGATGVLWVPAGVTGVANDQSLTEVDPNLGAPGGVAVDLAGNVYIGDNNNGVYLVPNENGTPNPNDAYLLAPVPAFANVDFDVARGILYIPTKPGSWGGWNGFNDVVAVSLNNASLGSAATGAQGTVATVNFGLSAGVNPAMIRITEAGAQTPDFAVVSGGTCATGTAYTAQSTCSVEVVSSPQVAGGTSGELQMLDAQNNTIASLPLSGMGLAAAISAAPALESAIGASLATPSQVAADAAGNSYVADAGLKKVLMYPAGATASTAGVSVGAGLVAPTGVAVDGSGDLFIADSGKVYELPYTYTGPSTTGQRTLASGLGTKLKLVADSLGNVYVADPDNARVVKIVNATNDGVLGVSQSYLTGFTAPSMVAVDGSNNLYLVDHTNLIEVSAATGAQTTVLASLGAPTGLAIDATGAVYASLSGGSVRIPSLSGVLTLSAKTNVGASVTNPTGLALDKSGNVYLADGTVKDLHLVSINATVSTGAPALGSTGTGTATVLNIGNAPLTVSSLSSSDAVDFSASGCTTAVLPNGTCLLTVTMNPGPGKQGALTSTITINSNATNSAVVDAGGTGAALAASKTAISVASTATVNSIPVTVTVTPASGTGVPSGSVIISVDGAAQPTASLTGGTVTITYTGLTAGTHSFSVVYVGDRTYGSSTASTTATIAKGVATFILPPPPAYSISNSDGFIPYNTTVFGPAYYSNYLVTVVGAGSVIPTGYVSFMQGSTPVCGPNTAPNLPYLSFTLGVGHNEKNVANAPGTTNFDAGCLQISNSSLSPNLVTPQLISSVVYSGDANYLAATATSTSAGKPILFEELRNPAVAISPNPGTLILASGTGSATLNINSVLGFGGINTNSAYPLAGDGQSLNNYTLPIQFACQGLPAHATCTFSGGNVLDPGTGLMDWLNVNNDPAVTQTIKVTINTNVSSGTVASQNSHPAPFEFAALIGAGLFGLAFGRKAGGKGRILMLLSLIILTGALASMTACGTVNLSTTPILTTPSGSYAVTVTAQQVGSTTIQGSGSQGPIIVYGSTNQMSLPYTLTVTVQ